MSNEELKCLVTIYSETKTFINGIIGSQNKLEVEAKILNETGLLLAAKIKEIQSLPEKYFYQAVYEKNYYEKMEENIKKLREEEKKTNSDIQRKEIEFLVIKLEAIKKLLGDELANVEQAEKEKIFKTI